ncbi:unnamed protein product [Paramecium primaurelia]|uniref:Uncharacterized protein n=1 Tax=Paramecium primaurelia TaxID=5886 RepID=A0A8S1NRU7_PARPR|nr:unnamed protein product [Paramecium primaurelia]
MKVYATNYYEQRFSSQIFSKWRKLAYNQTRNDILQQVIRKTDSQIMQKQKEYEQLIQTQILNLQLLQCMLFLKRNCICTQNIQN